MSNLSYYSKKSYTEISKKEANILIEEYLQSKDKKALKESFSPLELWTLKEKWLSLQEAADILEISKTALLSILKRKKLNYKIINKRRKILLQDLLIYKQYMFNPRTYSLEKLN